MVPQGRVCSFNERRIDGITYFRCSYALTNKFRVTEDNIALDIYHFAIFSGFMNGGILQFRINHQLWLWGTASFTDPKDYETYIAVADIIDKKVNNIYFLCIGDGVNRKNIEALVNERQIKNVHFLGIRSDIENICNNLDIGVLLNTNVYSEGLSNAIMEMMGSGLPVIATNTGGTPELIENGIDGFLVESFAVHQIVNRLIGLINNEETRKRIGIKAAAKIKEQFGIERMISSYLNLYNKMMIFPRKS